MPGIDPLRDTSLPFEPTASDYRTARRMEYLIYVIPGLGILAYYLYGRSRLAKISRDTHEEAVAAGLTEPVTLHPLIDQVQCIGCGSCVAACPESPAHTVIGLIDGKASLVSPTSCIGHGACKAACPVGAIELVFGTATRGVDLPRVSDTFESNVPGVFIAGELGGMGLIRNAVEQGRQAVESIVKGRPRGKAPLDLDRVLAHRGGLELGTDARLGGALGQRVAADTIGDTLLGTGIDHLVDDAAVQQAIEHHRRHREAGQSRLSVPQELMRLERTRVKSRTQVFGIQRDLIDDRSLAGLLRDVRAGRVGPAELVRQVASKLSERLGQRR